MQRGWRWPSPRRFSVAAPGWRLCCGGLERRVRERHHPHGAVACALEEECHRPPAFDGSGGGHPPSSLASAEAGQASPALTGDGDSGHGTDLRAENARPVALPVSHGIGWCKPAEVDVQPPCSALSTDQKVTLFRRLFLGRPRRFAGLAPTVAQTGARSWPQRGRRAPGGRAFMPIATLRATSARRRPASWGDGGLQCGACAASTPMRLPSVLMREPTRGMGRPGSSTFQ